MAAVIVLGFRYPPVWTFLLLTKVTPGVGLLWFTVRRQWRAFGIALGATLVLVALSVALDPRLWLDWVSKSLFATASGAPLNQFSIPISLPLRLVVAAAVVTWGARTDRRWTVPVGATLALPLLWPSGLAGLAAIWGLARQRRPAVEPEAPQIGPGSRRAG